MKNESPAIRAAVTVGAEHGYLADTPVLLQDTNHTVLWLRPHEVVAKVGTRLGSAERLRHEHAVATALARAASPVLIARPLGEAVEPATGFMVTLWERLASSLPSEGGALTALLDLHRALARYDGPLPSFKDGVARARSTLEDDRAMALLEPRRRTRLRRAFDELTARLDRKTWSDRVLHGEPHDGNRIHTLDGIRFIDLEAVCRGPLEWDLAFIEDEESLTSVDGDLLSLLRVLNSARVATWCWRGADHMDLRPHAEHHLVVVERWLDGEP
jgi:hypothetical protein